MRTAAQSATPERQLRVAFLWNGAVQAEETLPLPRAVRLGSGPDALFPLPEGAVAEDELPLLEPKEQGYDLVLSRGMNGSVWLRGNRREVRQLANEQPRVALGPEDYGVVTVGSVSVFFQYVRAARELRRDFFHFAGSLFASLFLAAFLVLGFLVICFMEYDERRFARDSLDLPTDLIAKFMVVPPPEDILDLGKVESGTETEDPGLRDTEEAGGKKHEGEEGRVGREDATQEDTEIAEPNRGPVAMKVRSMGLLGALSGEEGNPIAEALDVPQVSDILSGLGSPRTILGRGSRGAGLRGSGTGGGGTGPGNLFGAGGLGTGVGAGNGSGLGKGAGGIGVKGRERREMQISVQSGTPRVNGYLSPEQINRVVRAHQAAIRYCYELEVQRQPNLRGRVEIAWRINLQGSVTTSRVASSTLRNARVEGCIVRQVRNWRFPQPDGGEVSVEYPFIFGLQGG